MFGLGCCTGERLTHKGSACLKKSPRGAGTTSTTTSTTTTATAPREKKRAMRRHSLLSSRGSTPSLFCFCLKKPRRSGLIQSRGSTPSLFHLCSENPRRGSLLSSRGSTPSLFRLCSEKPRRASDLSCMAPSPSALWLRKRRERSPSPLGVIPCDNLLCQRKELYNAETWKTARIHKRLFRFCSQECWELWLNSPRHMGSWSSPIRRLSLFMNKI